jgi:5'-3' exonuclease
MKLNLVIDASGIFYRSLFTVGNFGGTKGEKLLDNKKSQAIFMRKLASDFSTLVRSIEEPSRVIITMDSSSWRKSIIIEDGGYKGTREEKKDESTINWKCFYDLTDKFCAILSQKGYLISRVPGAEADDLLFFWSRLLNGMGENVVLITGDRDLLQVVGQHENNSWTIALDPVNNRRKISLSQETLDYSKKEIAPVEEFADIFSPDSWTSSGDVLSKIVNSHDILVVDTKKFCTMKVILGDGGDDVPSVVTWRDKKDPEKIRTMTENNYQKILATVPHLNEASWEDLAEDSIIVEGIATTMEGLKKIDVDRELLIKNIQRNAKLVILSMSTIPPQIFDNFKSTLKEGIHDQVAVTGRDSILNGTEWWTSDKTDFVPKSYDLFGE